MLIGDLISGHFASAEGVELGNQTIITSWIVHTNEEKKYKLIREIYFR